jgi:3-deoxy-D-manno-octulosonic-acid transferase
MRKQSDIKDFVITTNTWYARDMLKGRLDGEIQVQLMPFDLRFSLKRFFAKSIFKAIVIIETEIWPNLIWEAKARGVKVIIVNGRISDKTIRRYKGLAFFFRHILSQIDLIIAQSDEHRRRYIEIGMDEKRVITTGNLKYYREIDYIPRPIEKEDAITFGSIKEMELGLIIETIIMLKNTFPDLKVFVAPRDIYLVTSIERELSHHFRVMRYSVLKKGDPMPKCDVIVVDTIGDLMELYKISKVAVIGGSFAKYGGQNMLEPLFFGTPVIFGPYTENFREIADAIIREKAGQVATDPLDLYNKLVSLIKDDDLRQNMGQNGKRVIDIQRSVMEETVDIILKTIEGRSQYQ